MGSTFATLWRASSKKNAVSVKEYERRLKCAAGQEYVESAAPSYRPHQHLIFVATPAARIGGGNNYKLIVVAIIITKASAAQTKTWPVTGREWGGVNK